ncbi:hypothetical protein [Neorhizobium alkalisoli]|uniref:hypothetical protein n=1 Tax=Neorhizobium alkalisoli TaxID=528178 RepID=UPI000CF90A85|nr:hypothetical protein [Neorhizobium alkalisoli]
MNASGEFPTSASSENLFGLRVCDLGWNAALSFVEGLVSLRGNRATVAFLDSRNVLRQLIDPAYRSELDRRLILPSGGRVLGMLSKGLREKAPPARFSAATFLPALLTFLEKSCRIGIAGGDVARLTSLRDHFARHAPWHEIVVVNPGLEPPRDLDFVVVDAETTAQEGRIERWLMPAHAGLVIFAGSGLFGLLKNKPVRTRRRSGGLLPQSLIGVRS